MIHLHRSKIITFFTLLSLFLLAAPACSSPSRPADLADLVEKLGPTVVNIYTTKVTNNPRGRSGRPFHDNRDIPEFFKRFFDYQSPGLLPRHEQKTTSLGSGTIISEDGYIVTNNHVVEGGNEIKVRFTNHSEYSAEIIGRDPKTDVALIKIQPEEKLEYADFGNSDQLRVGESVFAIGNPFGFENTVTSGIVSGKGRSFGGGQGQYENFIQTDASINMGNSGGPLFNLQGKLVGINTAIFSKTGGNIGLGFAIPANMASNVIEQLKQHGYVTRGWLGVMIQHVNAELAKQFGLDHPTGALVGEVVENSPAAKAGLRQGDIILEYLGKKIDQMTLLPSLVAQTPVGAEASLVIFRKGKKKKITVTIGKLDEDQIPGVTSQGTVQDLGLTVQELTPELAREFGLSDEKGLLISDVTPGSPAAEAGINRGEIILEINRVPLNDLDKFKQAMEGIRRDESILFLLKRGNHARFVVIRNN